MFWSEDDNNNDLVLDRQSSALLSSPGSNARPSNAQTQKSVIVRQMFKAVGMFYIERPFLMFVFRPS